MPPLLPEDFLRLAMDSHSPEAAAELARTGLSVSPNDLDPESRVLLLREILKTHLAAGRRRSAHAIARKMVAAGALSELAHADLGRTCTALGWWTRAAQAFRISARFAPARRRALHWAACASALQHAGKYDEALAALERAVRWSTTTRPLHRAHMALIRIDRGEMPDDLRAIESELEHAPAARGYGQYVLGRLAHAQGDARKAQRNLREFVQRNRGEPLRAATLAGELTRARAILRSARRRA